MAAILKDLPTPVFPSGNYAEELDPSDPQGKLHKVLSAEDIQLPVGVDVFRLSCDRSQFPEVAELVIKCRAEISYDGGQTWRLLIAFTSTGEKIIHPRTGLLITESFAEVRLEEPQNPNRVVRTTMIPIKGITTTVYALVRTSSA